MLKADVFTGLVAASSVPVARGARALARNARGPGSSVGGQQGLRVI
ncbi:hypothetical protein [Arthrobacter sp. 92]